MDLTTTKAVITTPIQIIGEVVHFIKSNTIDHYRTTSLPEVTKMTRIEPIVVMSRDLVNVDYTSDVLQSVLNVFAGYYLQAVSLSARIGNIRVTKILDRLNPDRDSTGFFAGLESYSSIETLLGDSYTHKLPGIATEARLKRMLDGEDLMTIIDDENKQPQPKTGSAHPTERSVEAMNRNEAANLAVGKLLSVEIHVDDQSITVPVNIRLAPVVIPDSSVVHMLSIKKDDNSLTERYHKWRAGRISFIRDLMLCSDMINEHKKAMINDDTGTYNEIVRRANNAKKYGLLTQNPSLVSASSIFMISEKTAKEVEHELGGKLSNPRIREKAFDNTYGMILVVIDREWERVTIYHRGITAATDVSVRDIKTVNKKSGPDISDILKNLTQGNQVSF